MAFFNFQLEQFNQKTLFQICRKRLFSDQIIISTSFINIPVPKTKISSESFIVEIRCAITIDVLFFIIFFKESCTTISLCSSKALVASSNRKIFVFLIISIAIAILCFWPPEIWFPFDPPSKFAFELLYFMLYSQSLRKEQALEKQRQRDFLKIFSLDNCS